MIFEIYKRLLDIVASLVAVTVFSPFFLLAFILVRVKLGSPVFFTQLRAGKNGKPFTLIKFRTMSNERDDQNAFLPDAERLTAVGSFLRRTSIDELPEFWNILKGDMSLVGPRPLLLEYLPLYSQREAKRHDVKPGLTGIAQINGRNKLDWDGRLELDVWYVENKSILLDIRIIIRTVWVVLKMNDVQAIGETSMAKFTGSVKKKVCK